MAVQNPVIVVPGVTATSLVDDYPLRTDELWSMVVNKVDLVGHSKGGLPIREYLSQYGG